MNIWEIFNDKNFEKSKTQMETHETIAELEYPQDYDSDFPSVINLNDLNEKEITDPKVQAMFRSSR